MQVTVLLMASWELRAASALRAAAACSLSLLGFWGLRVGRLQAPFKIMWLYTAPPLWSGSCIGVCQQVVQEITVCCEVGRVKYPVASLVCLSFFVCGKHTACCHLLRDCTGQLLTCNLRLIRTGSVRLHASSWM